MIIAVSHRLRRLGRGHRGIAGTSGHAAIVCPGHWSFRTCRCAQPVVAAVLVASVLRVCVLRGELVVVVVVGVDVVLLIVVLIRLEVTGPTAARSDELLVHAAKRTRQRT